MKASDPGLLIWKAKSRGRMVTDWLDARLTLDFGPWRMAGRDGFGPLRVLNDDRVSPRAGFDLHEHRDLDILMVPLTTAIRHEDTQGRHQLVRPGQIQWMRAGRGMAHKQINASALYTDRHLQLWVEPRRRGLRPEVHVHDIGIPEQGCWKALCGQEAGLFQPDAVISLRLGRTGPGKGLNLKLAGARLLQVIHGQVDVSTATGLRATLQEGDSLVFRREGCPLHIEAPVDALLLCVDLPTPLS